MKIGRYREGQKIIKLFVIRRTGLLCSLVRKKMLQSGRRWSMESRFQGQLSSSIFSVPFSVETGIRISSENLMICSEVFHCQWPTCPIWTVAGSRNVHLGRKNRVSSSSSLDSDAQFLRCVLAVLAMSRPIFSRAPRMAPLRPPQNGRGVLWDSLDECRARDTRKSNVKRIS